MVSKPHQIVYTESPSTKIKYQGRIVISDKKGETINYDINIPEESPEKNINKITYEKEPIKIDKPHELDVDTAELEAGSAFFSGNNEFGRKVDHETNDFVNLTSKESENDIPFSYSTRNNNQLSSRDFERQLTKHVTSGHRTDIERQISHKISDYESERPINLLAHRRPEYTSPSDMYNLEEFATMKEASPITNYQKPNYQFQQKITKRGDRVEVEVDLSKEEQPHIRDTGDGTYDDISRILKQNEDFMNKIKQDIRDLGESSFDNFNSHTSKRQTGDVINDLREFETLKEDTSAKKPPQLDYRYRLEPEEGSEGFNLLAEKIWRAANNQQ